MERDRMRRLKLVAVTALIGGMLAGGCGDSDSGSPARPGQVMEEWLDRVFSDDPGSACDLYTERYRRLVAREGETDTCEDATSAELVESVGLTRSDYHVRKVRVKRDRATALITFTVDTGQEFRRGPTFLRRVGDEWLIDGEGAESDELAARETAEAAFIKWAGLRPATADEGFHEWPDGRTYLVLLIWDEPRGSGVGSAGLLYSPNGRIAVQLDGETKDDIVMLKRGLMAAEHVYSARGGG
jgi:hypothetical protein